MLVLRASIDRKLVLCTAFKVRWISTTPFTRTIAIIMIIIVVVVVVIVVMIIIVVVVTVVGTRFPFSRRGSCLCLGISRAARPSAIILIVIVAMIAIVFYVIYYDIVCYSIVYCSNSVLYYYICRLPLSSISASRAMSAHHTTCIIPIPHPVRSTTCAMPYPSARVRTHSPQYML